MKYDKLILELIKTSKHDNASKLIKQAFLGTNSALYYYYSALNYCAQREYKRAIELLKLSERCGFKSDLLFYNMGVVYLETNNLSLAEAYFKKSILLNNSLADAYQNLAHIYIKTGEIHKAYRSLKTCTSLNSNEELLIIENSLLSRILKIS